MVGYSRIKIGNVEGNRDSPVKVNSRQRGSGATLLMVNEAMLRWGFPVLMTDPPNVKYVDRFKEE